MIRENEPLAKHTSWRIGGPARYYCESTSVGAMREALQWAQERELPLFLLGGGTNLLVREEGFPGLVLRYRGQSWQVTADGDSGMLHVEAGAPMAGTVRRVCQQGWGGLEWAEGLPGTIGGAVYGNAGCYGGDIASVLQRVWLLIDGEVEEWPVERLEYGYRRSVLKQNNGQWTTDNGPRTGEGSKIENPIVLAADLRVVQVDPQELAATMAHIASTRKAKTPWGRSCGSVFKNPVGQTSMDGTTLSAGQLIDRAGLKGRRIGAAEFSERHGNYIVNLGDASSDDILRLVELAQETVLRQFGITLALEIQIV